MFFRHFVLRQFENQSKTVLSMFQNATLPLKKSLKYVLEAFPKITI